MPPAMLIDRMTVQTDGAGRIEPNWHKLKAEAVQTIAVIDAIRAAFSNPPPHEKLNRVSFPLSHSMLHLTRTSLRWRCRM